jgi:hypothetical protein
MKKFVFMESRYLQVRWEAFNALNHVNLDHPNDYRPNQRDRFSVQDARDANRAQIGFLTLSSSV